VYPCSPHGARGGEPSALRRTIARCRAASARVDLAGGSQAAIDAGSRTRITAHQDAEARFTAGLVVNAAPDGPIN